MQDNQKPVNKMAEINSNYTCDRCKFKGIKLSKRSSYKTKIIRVHKKINKTQICATQKDL